METVSVSLLKERSIIHYPTLKTVLLIENVLKSAETAVSREEIKRRLPVSVMHQTLNVVLAYLEESGKILITDKGVVWTFNPSRKLMKALEKGRNA